MYIFEIVEVVPDRKGGQKRWHKLKLRCRDDAKGPVTALCGMNGYLVSSMGQKVRFQPHPLSCSSQILRQIFVRAFDLDERLVGMAFLDVGVYVTTLRAIKNLLVIGDAVKSIWFVAFQVSTTCGGAEWNLKFPTGGSLQAGRARQRPAHFLRDHC